ncbi:putative arginine biosynthesis bifunctional protein argJ 1 [Coccomyxa subellipsoidea C-169]|uniref:Arginine biosynthesis bifunctional protein ArgJ, chloroplastic n=1 Tax=Coccomyxa subellipsoidea (strain C-169) TaxID=574566 RepID=I0YRT4_COCSC|nr:putative arginine biosynthesis bifunctional protein argJ 1 [Coccomyxa subellipsoidea C-169]EIE21103.1 putative arginine biosynthesis bifunctional protein argJ 1 [Coccomyxa subellipsoidea C-169]|eukprot:XP_005645647.1 putative arginine biosynthesis bifunctional protein argJ 1 [Coccomyxa subellipsoidea C-169]
MAEESRQPAAPILIPEGPWKEVEGSVNAAKGFKAQGMHGGLRASGPKADIALIVAEEGAAAAGAFTTNIMCAAPVTYCRQMLARSSRSKAVLINAGQANAATGDAGYQDCLESADAVAKALGIAPEEVLLLSTGVIGRRIKLDALKSAVPELAGNLGSGVEDAHHAAVAITTTDLVSKSAALEVEIGGAKVRVGGIAKGSGMIHPNMATMLSVITSDAAVDESLWTDIVRRGAINSFNQISVDGDTSTNDTVIGMASGAAGNALISDPASPEAKQLEDAVTALLQGLAKSIAWDGEGATCLMEVQVSGAPSDEAARTISKSVVASSLVKAAVYGHDPNWGRIACAAGYAGVPYDPNELNIQLGDIPLMEAGQPLAFDAKAASAYLTSTTAVHGTVYITLSVGSGPGNGAAWGCDLSYDYVKINAEYTT